MDALRKQATRLREQVSRQQAISEHSGIRIEGPKIVETELRQHLKLEKLYISIRMNEIRSQREHMLGISKQIEANEFIERHRERFSQQQQAISEIVEGPARVETDLEQHQKLEKLYISTRAGKQFQRDISRCVDGYLVAEARQVKLGIELSGNRRKYAAVSTENTSGLSKVALDFSNALAKIEKEHVDLFSALSSQVSEPLDAKVSLEWDLVQRYDRKRQEVEAQGIEVDKCEAEVREFGGYSEYVDKLEAAESKLEELRFVMDSLCKVATAVMAGVEAHQHAMTLLQLRTMVEAEKKHHHRISQIFEQLEADMG